jgi:hypothetical protein
VIGDSNDPDIFSPTGFDNCGVIGRLGCKGGRFGVAGEIAEGVELEGTLIKLSTGRFLHGVLKSGWNSGVAEQGQQLGVK